MTEEEKKQIKIILVDDDDFLVNMYATKFGNDGINVVACKSGEALIEKLKGGETADLILLDIVIPGMDGISTLEMMRKEKLGANIPVVMLTNQNDESDVQKTKGLGVKGYIVKATATPSEVVAEVVKIINGNK